jgi:hypothetical protein
METVRRSRKGIDYLATVLKEGKRVVTRAVFWKIPHTAGDEIHLKLGRYKRGSSPEVVDVADPKSELTLDNAELRALISFLEVNHEPFQQGARQWIALDGDFGEAEVEQLKDLFANPDQRRLLDFLIDHEVIPEDVVRALEHRARCDAVDRLEEMLEQDRVEIDWQKFFETNDWILGSDFVRILDERAIDTGHIADYLMEAYDGFLDLIEIKRPEGGLKFWMDQLDHGNYVPHPDLTKAITQASRYLYEVEREANSVKFLERVDYVKTIKPRCVLLFGRSRGWNEQQQEAYRLLNASYHNLTIMTYDHVLRRARRILNLPAEAPSPAAAATDDNLPF